MLLSSAIPSSAADHIGVEVISASVCVAVDGGWNQWSDWSTCSVQCERRRRRACSAPQPENRGRMCEGGGEAYESCSDGLCARGEEAKGRRHPAGKHVATWGV